MYRGHYRDKQVYDDLVHRCRREYQKRSNREIADRLSSIAEGRPRSMEQHEYEALMRTAASRLWNSGE